MRHLTAHLRLVAAAVILAVALPGRAGLPGTPVEQWRWEGGARGPQSPPVVVQLTDDNGDTVIDGRDIPDVVFQHGRNHLIALDGATGAEVFDIGNWWTDSSYLAAGDLDGDGVVELVNGDRPGFVVREHDGSEAWSAEWPPPGYDDRRSQTMGIADLNQDGVPEVYLGAAVLSVDGSLAWSAPPIQRPGSIWPRPSHAVDLVPESPGLELLSGRTLYDSNGNVVWQNLLVPDGATGVGDVDGDGDPEVVLVSRMDPGWQSLVHLLDHHGNQVGPTAHMSSKSASSPVVADLDADGRADAFVGGGPTSDAFGWDGTGLVRKWSVPTDESCCTDVTAYDFDGDGAAEIVYHDQVAWYVFDGRDGTVLHEEPFVDGTTNDISVIADIDNDGIAEILVMGSGDAHGGSGGPNQNSLVAYEVPGSVTPRAIWNQHAYHVCNVNDDGTIPQFEEPAWETHDSWFAQQVQGLCGVPCRTSIVGPLDDVVICEGGDTTLDARGLTLLGCEEDTEHEWTDDAGTPLGTDPILHVAPDEMTVYEVTVTCARDPSCFLTDTATVEVQRVPVFDSGSVVAVDPSDCGLGLLLTWEAATFQDPGGGVYNVYRSEGPGASCADALSRPPVASGLTELRWFDTHTEAGRRYVHVVEAEDASGPTACVPGGPNNGGAVRRACLEPGIIEEGPSISAPVDDALICRGSDAVLVASGLLLPDCAGVLEYEWTSGGTVVGRTSTLRVAPADTSEYVVTVSCSTHRACLLTDRATVHVQSPPTFDRAAVTDPPSCEPGLEVTWGAATFQDPLAGGVYHVYRSEGPDASCADALSRPPVVSGLTALRWLDANTRDGARYVYVVEAEDGVSPTVCVPAGPGGGAVARVCLEPIIDEGPFPLPEVVGAVLRAEHDGDQLTLRWPGARALLPAEHFHLLEAVGALPAPFVLANGEGDLSLFHSETDTTSSLQFFDLRVANGCEEVSVDEYPAGIDGG